MPGEVAKKLLLYLKQTLQASCLGDLLCSHTFSKYYRRRGGGELEDEEMLVNGSLGSSGLGGQGTSSSSSTSVSSSSSSSSSAMGSVSKKPKKEILADSGFASYDTESELPDDETKYPEDLEEKMKGVCV